MLTKIIFCDKDTLSRDAIKILLGKIPFIEVVGEFDNADDLIDKLKKKSPHIVFYDLQTNSLSEINEIKRILLRKPGVKVIVTSTYEDFRTIAVAFSIGAIGFLTKRDLSVSDLSNAINYAKKNNHYLSRGCEYKMEYINKIIQLN